MGISAKQRLIGEVGGFFRWSRVTRLFAKLVVSFCMQQSVKLYGRCLFEQTLFSPTLVVPGGFWVVLGAWVPFRVDELAGKVRYCRPFDLRISCRALSC